MRAAGVAARATAGHFGVLLPETVERVGQASVRDLKNVLDAGTLDEVFDTNR